MKNLLFSDLELNHREAIRMILIKYTKLYLTNPSRYGVNEPDKSLDILNGYLKFAAKPQWFDASNVNLISDCYDYIEFISKHIDEFNADNKFELLFPTDIISSDQQLVIRNLVASLSGKQTKSGKSFSDIDINYISKKKYENIIHILTQYVKLYERK